MIEYVNLLIPLTKFWINLLCLLQTEKVFLSYIIMDSEILDQLTILEKNVDSEVTKPQRGRKKKINPKINEVEDNDIGDKTCYLRSAW